MKRLLVFLPITILAETFIFNYPRRFAYIEPNWLFGLIVGIVILLVLPALWYFSFNTLKSKSWGMIAILSIPLNGIFFGVTGNRSELSELEKSGQWTKAVIINKKQSGKRSTHDWDIRYEFEIQHKKYESNWRGDYDPISNLGDSIDLIYLPDCPMINRPKKEWQANYE